MKRKKRSSKEKLMIVLEGLKGTVSLAELCSQQAIT
jgi:NhaP-type Na+/H+ or K+/H+ antiporter